MINSFSDTEYLTNNLIANVDSLYDWQINDYTKLWNIHKLKNKLPHSTLLYGMQGLGIVQLGGYFIKSIFCQSIRGNFACNQCQSCILINSNSHPDVYSLVSELESKSKNITIDSVRDVVEFLALSPHLGLHKIVFVPNVNSLTLNSANALLKILEEPPSYARFILVSNNIGQLLPTITSRCIKYAVLRPNLVLENNIKSKNDYFWFNYYDSCPLFEVPMSDNDLNIVICTLTTPSIDNIYAIIQMMDGKVATYSFILEFIQKWLSDIISYKITQIMNYFTIFKEQIMQIMPNLNLDKAFYLSDQLTLLIKWAEHSLNQKLQLENLLFKYQQIFVANQL